MRRIFFFLFVICFIPQAAFSQDLVDIKADHLKLSDDGEGIGAYGSVEVVFKKTKIKADQVYIDKATDIVTAEGHVTIIMEKGSSSSKYLTYNITSEALVEREFNTKLSPKNMKGYVYVYSERIHQKNELMSGEAGILSTCERQQQHFYITAEKFKITSGQKMEGNNVVFHVGNLPVLWLPYFYFDPEMKQSENINFGQNPVEGTFVKTKWGLPWGGLLLDYMQLKGIGYGVQYGLSALGAGSLYLYHLNEKDSGLSDWITKLDVTKQINPYTTISLNQQYTSTYLVPSGRIEQTGLGFGVDLKKDNSAGIRLDTLDDRVAQTGRYTFKLYENIGKSQMNYYSDYYFSKIDPKWLRNTQNIYLKMPLGDNIQMSAKADYFHSTSYAGDPGAEKIEPQIELTGGTKYFSWRATRNWFIDLRSELYPNDPKYEFLEKKPEFEINLNSIELPLCILQPSFGYGVYREVKYISELGRKRDFESQKGKASLTASKAFSLLGNSTGNFSIGVDQFSYGTGDQMYAYRESAALQTELTAFLRNNVNYRRGKTDGNTPFLFDKLGTNYHDLTDRVTLHVGDRFNWTFDGGKNWQTGKWFDVMTAMSFSLNQNTRFTANTGWDLENRIYKDLTTGVHLSTGKQFSADLFSVQDINNGGIKQASAIYNLLLLEGEPNQMAFNISQVYDPATKEFKLRDIMLKKDLHCFEMKVAYSDYLKQTSFIFTLKALPDQPLGYGSSRGFYFEGFDREINKLMPTEQIRRF